MNLFLRLQIISSFPLQFVASNLVVYGIYTVQFSRTWNFNYCTCPASSLKPCRRMQKVADFFFLPDCKRLLINARHIKSQCVVLLRNLFMSMSTCVFVFGFAFSVNQLSYLELYMRYLVSQQPGQTNLYLYGAQQFLQLSHGSSHSQVTIVKNGKKWFVQLH